MPLTPAVSMGPRSLLAVGVLVVAGGAPSAGAQVMQRAAFVGNNGNLEGSVSSFVFDAGGVPQFVARVVTGSRPNSQVYHPGTNAYCVSLAPGGRWLAVGHTTESQTVERVTILEVHGDATMSIAGTFTTDDSPLDVQWLADDALAVTRTDFPSEVIVYRWGAPGPTLTEIDREPTGSFTAYLTLDAANRILWASDSTGYALSAFAIQPDGTLTLLGAPPTGAYPLDAGVSSDGRWLFAGGGISAGGRAILGFTIQPATGGLDAIPGSPFVSPGTSPKLARFSADDRFLFVGHGTDATTRMFAVEPSTGAITPTGAMFDTGLQGSLGDVQVLGDLLLLTDNFDGPTGLYSFTIHANGTLTPNGGLVGTQGVAPRMIAVWAPPEGCYADCDGSGALNVNDFICFQTRFALGAPYADCDGDGVRNVNDFICFQTRFALGC